MSYFALNKSHALNQGLVALWAPCSNVPESGRTRDIVGANHGTYSGTAVSWEPHGRPGPLIGDHKFGGASSKLSISDSTTLRLQPPLTIALWTFRQAVGSNYPIPITKENYASSKGFIFGCLLNTGADLPYTYRVNASTQLAEPTTVLNTWVHSVVTHIGATATIYRNGIKIASGGSFPTTINYDATALTLGNDIFKGWVGIVRLYSRGLADGEAQELYADEISAWPETWIELPNRRRLFPGVGGAAATVRDMSQMHLGSVSFSHRNILQRGSIGVNS